MLVEYFFFFKQKTAYELRISDWSSDVCSSDLLASCRLAIAPGFATQLWLVASGAPYWRAFPRPTRYWLPLAYRFMPWLADRCGALPGHRIGFGGTEEIGRASCRERVGQYV